MRFWSTYVHLVNDCIFMATTFVPNIHYNHLTSHAWSKGSGRGSKENKTQEHPKKHSQIATLSLQMRESQHVFFVNLLLSIYLWNPFPPEILKHPSCMCLTNRVIIKTCSLYLTHWVGKEHCLLCCGNRLALVRPKNKDGDSFIEIRCRRPEKNEGKSLTSLLIMTPSDPTVKTAAFSPEYRQLWDLILAVMSKLFVLSRQWPGLTLQVHTPCPERGCLHYFTWRDCQELTNINFYNLWALSSSKFCSPILA